MTPLAVVTMVVIVGFVWGGFLGLLWRALRCERGKRSAAPRGVR